MNSAHGVIYFFRRGYFWWPPKDFKVFPRQNDDMICVRCRAGAALLLAALVIIPVVFACSLVRALT